MICHLSYFVFCVLCLVLSNPTTVVDGAAMQFTLPKDDVLVCSDSLDNVCTAPTSCNKNGKAYFDSGKNFNVGKATQNDGVWTIVGGYTIDFPSLCNVTCQGNCTCETCTMIEVDNLIATADGTTSAAKNLRINGIATVIMAFVVTTIFATSF
jgi:hypothetical protein